MGRPPRPADGERRHGGRGLGGVDGRDVPDDGHRVDGPGAGMATARRSAAGGPPRGTRPSDRRRRSRLRALHVRRHAGSGRQRRDGDRARNTTGGRAGGRDRAGLHGAGHDLRWPGRRGARPARRNRARSDVRCRRPAHDGDDVLRADLCGAGNGAPRPRQRMDRCDGAMAARLGDRRHQRTMPRPPGRDAADLRTVRSGRSGGARSLCRVTSVHAPRVRLAPGRTRQHPPATRRPGGCRRGVHGGPRTGLVTTTRPCIAATRSG